MPSRLAAGAGALVIVLLAAGCGGDGAKKAQRRQAVTHYIDSVNIVERQLRTPLLQVERTYRSFSGRGVKKGATAGFVEAESTLRKLRTELAALDAPPDARPLRRRLLQLLDAERALAHELTLLAAFLPRFSDALRPLAPADKQLKTALAAVTVPKPKSVPASKLAAARAAYKRAVAAASAAQAAALETYVAKVAAVRDRLRPLHAPPAVVPAYRTQLQTLARVITTGRAVIAALRAGKYTQVAALDQAFQQAAATSTSLSAQREQIAAVKAYDARVRAVNNLALAVDRERSRLQKTLG